MGLVGHSSHEGLAGRLKKLSMAVTCAFLSASRRDVYALETRNRSADSHVA